MPRVKWVILHIRCGQLLHTRRGRSVCQHVTAVSPSITAQPIDMPFGLTTWVGPRKESCIVISRFSIRTSLQRGTILVCENTKTESIYFDGKFLSKYIDRPRQVWSELFFTLGVVNSFTLGVVNLSVNLSQLGIIFKNCVIQTVGHIFCYLVWPQNRLGPRFRFSPNVAVSVLKPTQPYLVLMPIYMHYDC